MRASYASSYNTGQGTGAVAASELGICGVWLPGDDLPVVISNGSIESELTKNAAQQLEQYFLGRLHQFDLALDISLLTLFQQQVLRQTMQIPYGSITTYGELAGKVGSPKAARAVGGALGANPIPVIIPCHRVVASNGGLTGYSAAGGIEMKKFLLSLEGADFIAIKKA